MKTTQEKKKDTSRVGRIGETYVLYRLARLGIHAIKVSEDFDFDLLTNTGLRLEVKTATKQLRKRKYKNKVNTWYAWGFGNKRLYDVATGRKSFRYLKYKRVDRKCDFFICVCLNEDYEIEKCHIIPKKVIGTNTGIAIGMNRKSKYDKYKERWNLLEGRKGK